ncbi:MAG: hypothetical protein C0596_07365 [Marinilabiliales bacterium]|nr:MAG: hypothetical protein C0596_07365 [Marinilabiliales bacterium]
MVTVYDANTCSVVQQVDIVDIGGLVASSTITANQLCYGSNEGEIDVSISTGTPNYTIDYGTGSGISSTGSYTITGLTDGAYTIIITDANSCQAILNETITEPTELQASSISGTIACNGGTTTVTVSALGGTGPYSGTGTFTVGAGTYNYTVTDAN